MSLSMFQASVPAFVQTLSALSRILDKAAANAAARKIDPAVFLNARIAPDMFPLTRQIQVASDFAKNTMARLAGIEAPKMADTETSIDELKARIAKTIEYVKTFSPGQIDGSEQREITLPAGSQSLVFKGQDYLINFALPNFYFHATTAYDILRHNGVDIGKRDFLNRS
jgi:hypothetical protein